MLNEEILQEWREDLKREAYEDEKREYELRTDYDYFLEYYSDEIDTFIEAYLELKEKHELYDLEFNMEEIAR